MYSGGIETWNGTSTAIGVKKGWMGQIWTALVATSTEPHPDNFDWKLDTPLHFTGFGIAEIPNPRDYQYAYVTGFGIAQEMQNRPLEVMMYGFGVEEFRNKPYLKIIIV